MFEKKKYKSQRERDVGRINKYLFKHDNDDGMFMKGFKTLGDWTLGTGLRAGAAGLDAIEGDLLGGKQIMPKALQGQNWTDEGTQRDWTGQDAMDVAMVMPATRALGGATKVGQAIRKVPGGKLFIGKGGPGTAFNGPKFSKYTPGGRNWGSKLQNFGRTKKGLALKTAAASGTLGAASNMIDGVGLPDQEPNPLDPNQTLDDPTGQNVPGLPMEGAGAGAGAGGQHPATAFQTQANSMPGQVRRLGGSGSTMPSLAQGRMQAEADRLMDNEIKKSKGTYNPTYSEDPNYFMKQRYESTGGRAAGDWDAMTPEQKRAATSAYQQNNYYDSSSKEGRAADQRLKDSGWTAPRADGIANAARQELGMNSLQDHRAEEAAKPQWGGGNYFADPDDPNNENIMPGQVTRQEFMDKSGMQTPGTGLTQNPDGSYQTHEYGDTYEKSGGDASAEEYLVGPQEQPPEPLEVTDVRSESADEFLSRHGTSEPDGQPTFTSGATPQQMELNRPTLPQSDPLAAQPTPAPQGEGKMEPFVDEQGRRGFRPTEESLASPLPSEEEYLKLAPDGNYEEYVKSHQSMAEDRGVMGGGMGLDNPAPDTLTAPGQAGPRIEGGHAKLANLMNQAGDRSVKMADGYSDPSMDMSEGTRMLSSDMQDYGDAAFKNKADALGYLNRQAPTMDEPAPEAPEPMPGPGPGPAPGPEDGGDFNWKPWAAGAGGAGLAALAAWALSRGRIKPKQAQKLIGKLGSKGPKPLGLPQNRMPRKLNNIGPQKALPLKPAPKQLTNTPKPNPTLPNKPTPKQLTTQKKGVQVEHFSDKPFRMGKEVRGPGFHSARHQPMQGPGVPKMTEKNARSLVQQGRNPDGSIATKEQRIAAMRYLKANRL